MPEARSTGARALEAVRSPQDAARATHDGLLLCGPHDLSTPALGNPASDLLGRAVVDVAEPKPGVLLPWSAGGPERRLRREHDWFDIGDVPRDGTRADEASVQVAHRLKVVVGPESAVVDRYLGIFSSAPAHHLQMLARRNGAILLAPTIVEALDSHWAAARRGGALTDRDRAECATRYCRDRGTAAVYDARVHALVLPTSYRAADLERVILHELGHALTVRTAWATAPLRGDLLDHLPRDLQTHVWQDEYGCDQPGEDTRGRVLEVLAEGYVWLLLGRAAELPQALLSALVTIIFEGDLPESGVRAA